MTKKNSEKLYCVMKLTHPKRRARTRNTAVITIASGIFIFIADTIAFAAEKCTTATNKEACETLLSDPPENSEVAGLPMGDIFKGTAKGIIQLILEISGILLFVALVVAGVMMVVSRGKEETLKKAKETLIYSAIGIIVIAVSYAIIFGIANLNFFSDITPP